jgi:hypothetical protein
MTQNGCLAAGDRHLPANSCLIGADELEKAVVKLPAVYVIALSAVVLFGIASAAWWAWLVSRGLTVAYTEGFRNIRLPEE